MQALLKIVHEMHRVLVGDTFTVALLMAVLATCILAFVFGAEPQLIVVLLALGVATAFTEARMRMKK
jgi:uncharacterized membrane protein